MFSARLTEMLDSKNSRGVGVTQGVLPHSHFFFDEKNHLHRAYYLGYP